MHFSDFKITITPELIDKIASSGISKILWAFAYTAFYITYASSPWLFLLLPLTIAIGPLHGAIINWFAHKYGYVNFKQKNTSKNLMPIDVFMMGEGYHNDHHQYPSNANFGVRWFEIDPVYYIILLFSKIHIVTLTPHNASVKQRESISDAGIINPNGKVQKRLLRNQQM